MMRMTLKNKGSVTMGSLVGIALVLFVFLAVIGPWMSFTKKAQAYGDAETCRLSAAAASFQVGLDVKVTRIDLPNPFYLDCPKRYVYLKKDSIKVDDVATDLSKLEGDPEKRQRQLKDMILGEMTKCWRSFGEGKDKIYTASAGQGDNKIETDDTACFSCSEMFIEKDFETTTIKSKDFYEYANTKTRLDRKSYVEYLTTGAAPNGLPPFEVNGEINLDNITLQEGQQWSTVFTIKGIRTNVWSTDLKKYIPRIFVGQNPPAEGSGVLDCYEIGKDGGYVEFGDNFKNTIGCEKDKKKDKINGFVFGRIAPGFSKLDFDIIETLTYKFPVVGKEDLRFPMTVRFIPTEDVFKEGQCKRLY